MIEKMTPFVGSDADQLAQELLDYDDTVFKDLLKIMMDASESLVSIAENADTDEFELRYMVKQLALKFRTDTVKAMSKVWNLDLERLIKGE